MAIANPLNLKPGMVCHIALLKVRLDPVLIPGLFQEEEVSDSLR